MLQNNLKKLMEINGNISVSDLAKATHLPQPTLYQLYTGVTENPRQKTLMKLAHYFSVSVNQLLGKEILPLQLPEKTKSALKLHTAPLLTWENLHHWPHHMSIKPQKEIFLDEKITETTFALTMLDNSMITLFPIGCILIFDPEKKAEDKDCAIFFL